MRNFIIALLATTAITAVAAPASALDANGALGIVNMQSVSGGSVQGGGINGGASGIAGVTASQTNQSAWTTGLAGTRLTLDNTGAQIVSEHAVSGGSQQSMVGGSLGLAASGGVGASGFSGSALSTGQFLGLAGHLSF
jgi:hypothetical protein